MVNRGSCQVHVTAPQHYICAGSEQISWVAAWVGARLLLVEAAHTVVDPRAVVIHAFDAEVANAAVVHTFELVIHALGADPDNSSRGACPTARHPDKPPRRRQVLGRLGWGGRGAYVVGRPAPRALQLRRRRAA